MEPVRYSPRHATRARRQMMLWLTAGLALATATVAATTVLPGRLASFHCVASPTDQVPSPHGGIWSSSFNSECPQ
jgi:hypothetical protein